MAQVKSLKNGGGSPINNNNNSNSGGSNGSVLVDDQSVQQGVAPTTTLVISPTTAVNAINTALNNNNNAPKYGTVVPNRIFVGGISPTTTELDLNQLFSSAYGRVTGTKIILDRAGVSKGYGFVTFETEEEAKRVLNDSENIILKERRLNIAPAVKKQGFSRGMENGGPVIVGQPAQVFNQNGVSFAYHNGMAFFNGPHAQQATLDPNIYQGGGYGGAPIAQFTPVVYSQMYYGAPTHQFAAPHYQIPQYATVGGEGVYEGEVYTGGGSGGAYPPEGTLVQSYPLEYRRILPLPPPPPHHAHQYYPEPQAYIELGVNGAIQPQLQTTPSPQANGGDSGGQAKPDSTADLPGENANSTPRATPVVRLSKLKKEWGLNNNCPSMANKNQVKSPPPAPYSPMMRAAAFPHHPVAHSYHTPHFPAPIHQRPPPPQVPQFPSYYQTTAALVPQPRAAPAPAPFVSATAVPPQARRSSGATNNHRRSNNTSVRCNGGSSSVGGGGGRGSSEGSGSAGGEPLTPPTTPRSPPASPHHTTPVHGMATAVQALAI